MGKKRKKAGVKTAARKANKKLILRALTDPRFRRLLATDPMEALGKRKLTDVQRKEVQLVLATVKGIESQMNVMADHLLCACGVIV